MLAPHGKQPVAYSELPSQTVSPDKLERTGADTDTVGEDSEDDEEEEEEESPTSAEDLKDTDVTLEKNCYSLVVVGCRHRGSAGGRGALLCVIIISVAQIVVIYLVAVASPEHYFGNGGWLVPITDAQSTNLMKAFASVLTCFQVVQEMQDVSTIFRVLVYSPRLPIKTKHKVQCLVALVLQYFFALLVLVVAMQLVLSRHRPMDTLWISYYVFLVLNFDNMLCRFILFCFDLELDWTYTLKAPATQEHRRLNRFYSRVSRVIFVLVPVTMVLIIFLLAIYKNMCPLTWLRYGTVSNEQPVLMISPNLGLPQGCCPLQVHWEPNRTAEGLIPVEASVPCLSHKAPEDHSMANPILYWIVWPDQRTVPTSLQILEGRGGDGTPAKISGSTETHSWQMRLWLSKHGYDGDAVYRYLIDRAEGISLYRSKFTYVGTWSVTRIPWQDRNRIFVTAQNPTTGALSPTPVYSEILLRELCAPFCWRCAENGACLHCENHYTHQGDVCQPCAKHCESCDVEGPGGCDKGQCLPGYGTTKEYVLPPGGGPSNLVRAMGLGRMKNVCRPCMAGANCTSCDMPEGEDNTDSEFLPCVKCADELGLENGTCRSCGIGNCSHCDGAHGCRKCDEGFTRVNTTFWQQQRCEPCAEHCIKCDIEGAGKCDSHQCMESYAREFGKDDCLSCSPNCKICNVSGPTGCNPGQCQPGYTQNKWQGAYTHCEACSAHCKLCHGHGPGKCDPGMCESGFGLQGSEECSACAEHNCVRCDESWTTCSECADGYGFSAMKTCLKCGGNCRRCSDVGQCTLCHDGFRISDTGRCVACADQCKSCRDSGEGFCDPGQCENGWTTVSSNKSKGGFTCRPCQDPSCKRCDLMGPSECDDPAPGEIV